MQIFFANVVQFSNKVEIFFRVTKKFTNAYIVAESNNVEIGRKFMIALAPGEMSSIEISKNNVTSDITIRIEEKL